MDLKKYIREIPNFPIPGVLFRDISPLLADAEILQWIVTEIGKKFTLTEVDAFAGIESRGFLIAMLLAGHFKKGFIPIRKLGKLPPPVVSENYNLEYGQSGLEMHYGNKRIVIIDDVLATGGTLLGAIKVAQRAGFEIKDVFSLINLKGLNQMKFNGQPVKHLIEYE